MSLLRAVGNLRRETLDNINEHNAFAIEEEFCNVEINIVTDSEELSFNKGYFIKIDHDDLCENGEIHPYSSSCIEQAIDKGYEDIYLTVPNTEFPIMPHLKGKVKREFKVLKGGKHD